MAINLRFNRKLSKGNIEKVFLRVIDYRVGKYIVPLVTRLHGNTNNTGNNT
jgi:hypothetical protein